MSDPNYDDYVLDADFKDLDTWATSGSASGGGSSGYSSGSSGIAGGSGGIAGGSFSGNLNHISYNVSGQAAASVTINTKKIEKTKIRYVVVLKDGHTLELDEQQQLTTREMIGISKFINAIACYAMALIAQANYAIVWSDLINQLGIMRHFTAGAPVNQYNQNGDTLYVFLLDPK